MKAQNLDIERDDMRFSRRSVYPITACISACIFSDLGSVLQRIGRTVTTRVYKVCIHVHIYSNLHAVLASGRLKNSPELYRNH